MGVDARFYIDGFTEPARLHESVIHAIDILSQEDSSMRMYISMNDRFDSRESWHVDDGYCVVDSLARAYTEASSDTRAYQIMVLKSLFPNRNIYLADDYQDRDRVVELLRTNPECLEKVHSAI